MMVQFLHGILTGGHAMSDRTIVQHISELVEEENRLHAATERPEQHAERIQRIEEELDQCWDLLRQRRALRGAGRDPETASPRSTDIVEQYLQ